MEQVGLLELWLPMLLSAVLVFVVSWVFHVLLPIHRSDHVRLPGEDTILSVMRDQKVGPGTYFFPYCKDLKGLSSDEMQEKFKRGPVGIMTVLPPGPPAMGRNLALWFLFALLIAFVSAYVAAVALPRGADYLLVHRVAGSVAITGFAASYISDSIWKGQRWSVTLKFVIEGIVYGMLTGGTFGWLWPA